MVLFTLCFFLTTNKISKKQNENENGKHGQRDMQRGKKARGGGGIGRKEPYAHSREGAWNGLQKEPATPRSETSNLQMVRQQTAVVLITQAVGFSAITALTNLESHIMERIEWQGSRGRWAIWNIPAPVEYENMGSHLQSTQQC